MLKRIFLLPVRATILCILGIKVFRCKQNLELRVLYPLTRIPLNVKGTQLLRQRYAYIAGSRESYLLLSLRGLRENGPWTGWIGPRYRYIWSV